MPNDNKNTENQDTENQNTENQKNSQKEAEKNNPLENTADPKYFEDLPREGGINPANNVPSKGGRYGNASVEDGGTTEGSSTGSH